jgi:hypothetical protein
MKFEVYIPDEFIERALRYEEEMRPYSLRQPINLLAKIIFDYYTDKGWFYGRLDEPYVRRIDGNE